MEYKPVRAAVRPSRATVQFNIIIQKTSPTAEQFIYLILTSLSSAGAHLQDSFISFITSASLLFIHQTASFDSLWIKAQMKKGLFICYRLGSLKPFFLMITDFRKSSWILSQLEVCGVLFLHHHQRNNQLAHVFLFPVVRWRDDGVWIKPKAWNGRHAWVPLWKEVREMSRVFSFIMSHLRRDEMHNMRPELLPWI